MEVKKGKIYIIGAGPGDPELISVKGLNILKEADFVLYDFLSAPELLDHTKDSCEKICVGKKDGLHLKEQSETNRLLLDKASKDNIVVRLKGGDPFVFSRGSEEARYLRSAGINVEVIPGITSAFAAPASFGIPLTVKNEIQSVAVITGRKSDKDAEIEAPGCGTLVYLMAVANISNVVKALRKSGRKDEVPCAFIEKATRPETRITVATIGTIEEKVKKEKIKPPAILIVGNVVNKIDYED
ncbi:MAG: uroporphyrinogen-III C-methyltransferase [Candidatus Aadella gelida]|nr:uroporphyrinogen-III C-methyltransferase [Candidatus Aadella gelida]